MYFTNGTLLSPYDIGSPLEPRILYQVAPGSVLHQTFLYMSRLQCRRWQTCRQQIRSEFLQQAEFCSRLNCVYTLSTICVYTREYNWSAKSITLELAWKQHDRHPIYVIAQQYSFANCLSARFHIARELSACLYKMLLFQVNLFL